MDCAFGGLDERGRRKNAAGGFSGKGSLSSRAQASVSKKLLQAADKIESDAPGPCAIATTLRYECILTCMGSLLARKPATYQAADKRHRRVAEERGGGGGGGFAQHFF